MFCLGKATETSVVNPVPSCRTNLPKEVMAFPDFPFDPALPSFLHHSDVLAYLESYAKHFGIKDYVRVRVRGTGGWLKGVHGWGTYAF